MLRGQRLGLQELPDSLGNLLETRSAVRMGLSDGALSSASPVQLLAWTWLLQNTEAYSAVMPRGTVVRFENLAASPVENTRALFRQLHLPWAAQTETFLMRAASRDGSYYATYRRASSPSESWRKELDNSTISTIRSIVTKGELGRSFFPDVA
jgi:hypothetical protein